MILRLFLVPFLFFSILCPPAEDISIGAESVILMEPWTGYITYSKNPHLRLSPASTTKIMTAIVSLKNSKLRDTVTVSKYATTMEPSKIYVKKGEVYYVEDLLKAILLNSGNDAAVVLAEGVAGSEDRFVEMMNETAKSLGAKNTNFRTPNGLPAEDQYSTAYDLALIVREAMKYKELVKIMKMKHSEIREVNTGRRIKLKNHNKSLWWKDSYLVVGKTGYTKKARHCFSGYIEYNRWLRKIVVILKNRRVWPDLKELAEKAR